MARCTAVIDCGTQTREWKGEKKIGRQVIISWEFPEVKAVFNEEDGEQPLGRSRSYSVSFHEKATLRQDLVAWRGQPFTDKELEGFQLTNVLGHPCLIQVIHEEKNGEKYDKIQSVSKLPKQMPCPDAINEPYAYDIDQHPKNWDRLPKWIQEKIQQSPEYKGVTNTSEPIAVEAEESDEIPF